MPNAVHKTSAVTATVFAKTFQPDPPRAIISEEPACDSEPCCRETQTELARANRVAILGQLSASIAEINQPISAVVMNAEAALRLLLAQPTDTARSADNFRAQAPPGHALCPSHQEAPRREL